MTVHLKNNNLLHNIGIIAHVDAGKTTLTERILFYTGKRHKIGDVHDGNCATDSSAQEQAHGITIQSAAVSVNWLDRHHQNRQINIIDTPGHIDFNLEVQRALRVLDGAVVVFDAVAGVEPQTEANWRLADQHQVPRIGFVNKMDRVGADYVGVINAIKQQLGANPLVCHWPIFVDEQGTDTFVGMVDLLSMEQWLWSVSGDANAGIEHEYAREPYTAEFGEQHAAQVQHGREQLLLQLAELDDDLMTVWLSGKTPSLEQLMAVTRQACLERSVVPVTCGSAFRNRAVQPLLDAIVQWLPTPADVPAIEAMANDADRLLQPTVQETFTALVFKVSSSQSGANSSVAWLRCYSGQASSGDKLLNSRTGKTERLGQIYRMHADQRERMDHLQAGDIVAVQGLKSVRTGDTLCMPDQALMLESIATPKPVMAVAVEAENTSEQEKLLVALRKLCLEDPSLSLGSNEQGQLLLSGMGELHLQMLAERLVSDFGLNMRMGAPQVSYRERFTESVTVNYVHKKQDGGAGQWAKVVVEFTPIANWHKQADQDVAEPVVFVNRITGGNVPTEYIPNVAAGIRKAAQTGVLAGHPCQGLQATLLDGDWHSNDSSALAFEIAGQQAFRQAARSAACRLMEPVMSVQISTPLEYLGDCIGDLNRRRGLVNKQEYQGELAILMADVPLVELFGYINDLRSLSAGRAQYSMAFSHYGDVPQNIAATLLEQDV